MLRPITWAAAKRVSKYQEEKLLPPGHWKVRREAAGGSSVDSVRTRVEGGGWGRERRWRREGKRANCRRAFQAIEVGGRRCGLGARAGATSLYSRRTELV